MCLYYIKKKYIIPRKGGVGYKCMLKNGPCYNSPVFPGTDIPIGMWVTDYNKKRIEEEFITSETYRAGFHIFTKLDDAEMYGLTMINTVIVKVKYNKVVAVGHQEGEVVVAKRMLIIGEI